MCKLTSTHVHPCVSAACLPDTGSKKPEAAKMKDTYRKNRRLHPKERQTSIDVVQKWHYRE